jgi:hypothetical protein
MYQRLPNPDNHNADRPEKNRSVTLKESFGAIAWFKPEPNSMFIAPGSDAERNDGPFQQHPFYKTFLFPFIFLPAFPFYSNLTV